MMVSKLAIIIQKIFKLFSENTSTMFCNDHKGKSNVRSYWELYGEQNRKYLCTAL